VTVKVVVVGLEARAAVGKEAVRARMLKSVKARTAGVALRKTGMMDSGEVGT
jgi:hypothetical protein